MIGLGTIINAGAIILGGLIGLLFGRFFNERIQDTLIKVCGLSTFIIALGSIVSNMVTIVDGSLSASRSIFIIVCLVLGAFIGEVINIEKWFERFGDWLKVKTGNKKDAKFTEGFVTASLTVCIGAMAVIGAIEDGINKNIDILVVKAILDFIIILVMTCSLGKGCLFSSIPVFIIQYSITLLAFLIAPVLIDEAITNLSLIGNILIMCVGINLIWGKKIKVANLLPALIFAIAVAYLPFDF